MTRTAPMPATAHQPRPSSRTVTGATPASVVAKLAAEFLDGRPTPQIVNGMPVLEYLASLQWDRSVFPSKSIASRLNCIASPAQTNEVAATLRSRIVEAL